MTSDVRARLAGAPLYPCPDARRSRGALPQVLRPGLRARARIQRPAAGLGRRAPVAGTKPGRPWFAIGGIALALLADVLAAGASRVAVVRAITEADDPAAAALMFARRLRRA